jgi:hypothetical protein
MPANPGEQLDPAAQCAACPHPSAAHDPVALRYCQSTRDRGQPRACLCTAMFDPAAAAARPVVRI